MLACAVDTPPPDVLLVVLDTVRADAIGPGGAPTPALDAIARAGVRLDRAESTAPLTVPAHASLFTGLYPDAHGVRVNSGYRMPPGTPTLAGVLSSHGWQTGAFVAASVLAPDSGLDAGFDQYVAGFDATPGLGSAHVPRWPADVVRGRAQAWLDAVDPSRPFFLFVHFYDAHLPLHPPSEWVAAATGDPYRGAVAFMDHQVGILMEQIAGMDRTRPLAVLVTADHGEDRGDHGEFTHGTFVYGATLDVPLVASWPGVSAPRGLVSLVDVMPTLLRVAGLPVPTGVDGLPMDEIEGNRRVYAESWQPRLSYGFHELRAWVGPCSRLVLGVKPALYDRCAELAERHEVSGRRLTTEMRTFESFAVGRPTIAGNTAVGSSLVALGYAAPLALEVGGNLPDPSTDPDHAQDFWLAVDHARRQPPGTGVPELAVWVEHHPRVGAARVHLAHGWATLGEFSRARDALAPLRTGTRTDPVVETMWGATLMEEGDLAGTELVLAPVCAAHQTFVPAWAVWAETARRRGDCPAAEARASAAIERADASLLREVRAACRRERGDIVGAHEDESAAERLASITRSRAWALAEGD